MTGVMKGDDLLEGYLKALGVSIAEPDLELVKRLQRAHIAQLSFNNLGVLLGETLSLDLEALFDKIVVRKRGGYCFEQNKLFFHVLKALGYEVRIVLGRVTSELSSEGARTHRFTLLKYDGREYAVDVGFGPGTLRGVMPFELDAIHAMGPAEARFVKNDAGEYVLQSRKDDAEFSSSYTFDLARYTEGDCEMGHFYSYAHPEASFRNRLLVSLLRENETRSLFNDNLRVTQLGGNFVDTSIDSAERLSSLLREWYDIGLSSREAETVWKAVEGFVEDDG